MDYPPRIKKNKTLKLSKNPMSSGNTPFCNYVTFIPLILILLSCNENNSEVFIRVNQVGYIPSASKIAIGFSDTPIDTDLFQLCDAANESIIYEGEVQKIDQPSWGRFPFYYKLDFSKYGIPGRYYLQLKGKGVDCQSPHFNIDPVVYDSYLNSPLIFMRQQRCGYNPFLDIVCHQKDGRSFYGPMPDSTFVDVSGGWHDAGDQLKYLITGSNATANLLLAYELNPHKFSDVVNNMGQPDPNGIPDVLDEAKWGLDWLLKLHPSPGSLVHQVADDRDHIGWKWPDRDSSDYGWGPGEARAAYFATGKPQGLSQYKSSSTGMGNIAGRTAAALAMGSRIWSFDEIFAGKCLKAAKEIYDLGKQHPGFQQGNSYGAPYRYNEETWTDDMEWGAAELFKATGQIQYMDEAINFAHEANYETSWMNYDSSAHYQRYPFINLGHFALFSQVNDSIGAILAEYYRNGILKTIKRAEENPYSIGTPFIWCSNNLLVNLIIQVILYERMTGDNSFREYLSHQIDWIFGKNPWGTSMITGIPAEGEYPVDVHTSVYALTGKEVVGGLVDGPVYGSIYQQLIGLALTEPDEFAHLQNKFVVYHDDIGDYSTNEPTMDGTASAILMLACLAGL
jgi:endoglucanase